MGSVVVDVYLRIFLTDPVIDKLQLQFIGEPISTIIHPFKHPARSLNLIIPLKTRIRTIDQNHKHTTLHNNKFRFTVYPKYEPMMVLSAPIFSVTKKKK
eukprot:280047_1